MHEYQQYEQWTHIAYKEEIYVEHAATQCTPVGKLVAHNLMGNVPAYEKASEESADRQEHLPRDEIENVEQCLSEERQMLNATKRQRAKGTHHTARHRHYKRCHVARHMEFFLEERRAYLMKRNERRKCGKRQQCIKHECYDIAHYRQRRKCLLEHVGQSDENK